MKVEVIDAKLFAGVVADEILALLNEAIAEKGVASLVLSGGKTPAEIYRALARPPRSTAVDWSKVKIFLGDERWVPLDDDQSNFNMASETLLKELHVSQPQTFPVETNAASPDLGAQRYEELVRRELKTAPGGPPVFDVLLLGMGDDGHIASLFPHAEALAENKRMIIAVTKPSTHEPRVTVTPPVLLAAKCILFLVKGEEKATTVQRVIEGQESVEELPARLLRRSKERVTWFLDQAAAAKLSAETIS